MRKYQLGEKRFESPLICHWAAIPYVIAAVGTAVSVSAASEQASYQSQVAQNNQKIANANASLALQEGVQQEEAKKQATGQLIGRERAAAGASGIDANTGSAERVQEDTAKLGELDALTIRNNAARQAWNYQTQAASFGAQAQQAQDAGTLNEWSSLIGGASSVSSKWAQYQNSGA